MPVPRLSTLTMSLDLLDEITRKSNISHQFEADSTNLEKTMVCLQNGFGDELQQHNKYSVRRNVIPYPDHNYGQPPPPTPPEPASPDQNEQTDTGNEEEDETGVTRCICGFEHTDEYMICCDKCSSWQHIECMGIKSDSVPDTYLCNRCQPRVLDVERAKVIQSKKKEEMSDDDDDDDDEDTETDEEHSGTMYTAVSSTPTRITLTASTLASAKKKMKKQLKKTSEDAGRRKRRNGRKRPRADTGSDMDLRVESSSVDSYMNCFEPYQDIIVNRYHGSVEGVCVEVPELTEDAFLFSLKESICCIQSVRDNRKGLIALRDIEPKTPIVEFKGSVMLLSAFEDVNPFFRRRHPYVLFYNGLDHMQLAVDARTCGNEARFVRRSCQPNAEVHHMKVQGLLRFVIHSKGRIANQSEITIPFDFPIDSYDGPLECSCGQDGCPVTKLNSKFKNTDQRKKCKLSNGDSGGRQRKSPLGTSVSENQPVESESDENETEPGNSGRRRRKLSREERKLQAYMKQFEKMEKEEKKGGTVVPSKEAKDVLKEGRLNQICRLQDRTPNRDENGVIQTPKVSRRGSGKRRVSVHRSKRSRFSSCSSEPLSPVEDNTSVSTTSTSLALTAALSPLTDVNGLLKQKLKKEKEPLTLSLPHDRLSPNIKNLTRKAKKEGIDVVTSSPTPPETPGQVSPVGKGPSTPADSQSVSISPDVQAESPPIPSSSLISSYDNSKVSPANELLQISADQLDDTGSKSNSPAPTSVSSVGVVTSEELVGDLSRSDALCDDDDSLNAPEFKAPLRVAPCKYFGSMKKHWLHQHSESNNSEPNHRLNGISHLPLSTLISTQSIRSRAAQITTKSLSRFSAPGTLKKKRLQEVFGCSRQVIEQLPDRTMDRNNIKPPCAKPHMGFMQSELRQSPLQQIASKFIMQSPIRSQVEPYTSIMDPRMGMTTKAESDNSTRDISRLASGVKFEPLQTNEASATHVSTSSLKAEGTEESNKEINVKLGEGVSVDGDSPWRDEKAARMPTLSPSQVWTSRYSSTSSRESTDSNGFSRSDSVSSVEDSGSLKADRDKGKKKMSLSEYRNRQRTRPALAPAPSISVPAPSEVIVTNVPTHHAQSIFSETDSLLIPRTVSLSNSYVSGTGPSPSKGHLAPSVTSTNSAEPGPTNGPVFEPVSPSDIEPEGTVGESGLHYISTQSFAYPSTAVVSTTSLIHPLQRNSSNNHDGSTSDAMDIEDEEGTSPAGIQVGVPNSDVTSVASLTHSTLGSHAFTSPRLVLTTSYDPQMLPVYHRQGNIHGTPPTTRKPEFKMYDFQSSSSSKRSQQLHSQSFHG